MNTQLWLEPTLARWAVRKAFWDALGALKFAANRPAQIPIPKAFGRKLVPTSLAVAEPNIPVPRVLVADHVPADEAQPLKVAFYDVQVALYSLFSPMQAGLPPIAAEPARALAGAYGPLQRHFFPAPVRPAEFAAEVDLGRLAIASPYACYLRQAGGGRFEWDFRELDAFERHAGLAPIGARVSFRLDAQRRNLIAELIECSLGRIDPSHAQWREAQRLALCGATTHLSLIRHFGGVHLAAGGPFAMASRNTLRSTHPLLRLIWPHFYGTQYSNQIVTRGQMAPGGDFETIFSFTHRGMCELFDASQLRYDLGVLDPERDAARRGVLNAGFDTPALDNRRRLFGVIHAHTERYLSLYYRDAAELGADAEVQAWLRELERLIPNGLGTSLGPNPGVTEFSRLVAMFIYLASVEHEIVGTGLWNYQLWSDIQPVRIQANGAREPLDVYQRLVNANFNLNVQRAPLQQDFSYLALDARGAEAMRTFQGELDELQALLEQEPDEPWKICPRILEANINA